MNTKSSDLYYQMLGEFPDIQDKINLGKLKGRKIAEFRSIQDLYNAREARCAYYAKHRKKILAKVKAKREAKTIKVE